MSERPHRARRAGQILALARFTAIEALRTRLAWLLAAGLVATLLAAQFGATLAVTGSDAARIAFAAAGLRLFAVLVVALFVTTSMLREMADKGTEFVLALPLPRATWYLGKLAGHAAIAVAIAALAGAVMAALAPVASVLPWALALACELVLVAATSLLCLFTFSQVTAALSAVFAFYLLARTLDSLLLVAHGPVVAAVSAGDRLLVGTLDFIGLIVPRLGRYAQADWLVYAPPGWGELAALAGHAAVFLALVAAASLFDLYRKNY